MIAAESTGRRAAGFELDPRYVDCVIRRWQQMTGKHAVLAATGESFETVADARAAEPRRRPMADDYEVGFGKPPKHTRFRKGQSGNLLGRPKGSTNLQTEMKSLLVRKTKIKVNGVVETVPTSRALCLAQIQKALGGDVRAFSKIVEIAGPEMADELRAMAADLTSADFDLLRRALAREDEANSGPASSSTPDQPEETD